MSPQQASALWHKHRRHGGMSAASSVHFEMRVFAKFLDSDEPSNTQSVLFKRLALLCAPITAAFPAGADQRPHFAIRGAGAKGFAKICSLGRIQTAIPHA